MTVENRVCSLWFYSLRLSKLCRSSIWSAFVTITYAYTHVRFQSYNVVIATALEYIYNRSKQQSYSYPRPTQLMWACPIVSVDIWKTHVLKDEINQWTGSQDLGEFAEYSEKWYFQITAMIISHFWLDVTAGQWSFALLAGYSGWQGGGYSGWQGGEAKRLNPGCDPRSLPCRHGRASRLDLLDMVVSQPCQSWSIEGKGNVRSPTTVIP